ncbi:MAG: hypothetical protein AAB276_06035 [Pseudomonadota bacterium]
MRLTPNHLKYLAVVALSFLFLIPPSNSHAKSEIASEEKRAFVLPSELVAKWEKNNKIFNNWYLNEPDGCNKVFNFLWVESKKGDLEARYFLLGQMTMMHGPLMLLPGDSKDYLTRQRNYIIMAVHSIGSILEKQDNIKSNDFIASFYDGIKGFSSKSDFGKCMLQSRSQKCVQYVLIEERVPSFESFAREIDLFINAGYEAQCSARGHSD